MSDPVEGVDGGGADDADGADEEFDGDDRDDLDDDLDEEGSWFLLDADDPTVEGEVGEEAEVAGMPEVGTWSWQVPLRRVAMAEILGDRAWLDELDDSSLAGLLDADGDPLNPADVVVYADQLLTSLQELLADDELSLEDFARLHWVTIDLAVISRTADDATGGSSVALGNAASALDRLTRETDTMLRRRITLLATEASDCAGPSTSASSCRRRSIGWMRWSIQAMRPWPGSTRRRMARMNSAAPSTQRSLTTS